MATDSSKDPPNGAAADSATTAAAKDAPAAAATPSAATMARQQKRAALRRANLAASSMGGSIPSSTDPSTLPTSGSGATKLDASLKRHTALLARVRTSLASPEHARQQNIRDVATLTLEKYIEEACVACVEGAQRCRTTEQLAGAVEVISAFHQRFPQRFTPAFSIALLAQLKPQATGLFGSSGGASAQGSAGSATAATASLAAASGSADAQASQADKDAKEKDDNARVLRLRAALRLAAELEAIAALSPPPSSSQTSSGSGGSAASADGASRKGAAAASTGSTAGATPTGEITFGVLRELLTSDKDALALVAPLAIAFAKNLGAVYLPPGTADGESAKEQDGDGLDLGVAKETKAKFRKLLVAYFEAFTKRAGKEHIDLQRQDRRNHEAYIRSGEMFDDRERAFERRKAAWERVWASVTSLADTLGLPQPAPPSLPGGSLDADGSAGIVTGNGPAANTAGDDFDPAKSKWQDDEERRFYEEIRVLKGEVPGAMLGLSNATQQEQSTEEQMPAGDDVQPPQAADEDEAEEAQQTEVGNDESAQAEEGAPVEESVAPEKDAALPAGPAAQLTALLARLPEASSRSVVDTIAVEFAMLNSKAARRRLVRHLASVPRTRQDILPYYARLVATLNPYMPDIVKELITILEDEFKWLQRKKNADLAETRSKNLRFFSELVKFSLVPLHVTWHLFKVCVDDFTGANIDNVCTLLESCGRFLLKTDTTAERMRAVIDTIKRKKVAQHLDARHSLMLENAYYQCDPPERAAVQAKERTPMELYIRHLFYSLLTRNNSDKVLKLTRKLHWDDPLVWRKLKNAFTKVWKIKYSNVHLFAVLLHDLARHHPTFSVEVVDDVLENVRADLEVNTFKDNQHRIATVKYLGEMYNYRIVDSRVIFDTLWMLVTFGHIEGRPSPDMPTAIDAPDDFFRVRLVCVLLDTCGTCFDRGALKRKLDNLLIFFQLYILSKGPRPLDIDFMITDTFEQLRPKTARFTSYGEAVFAVDEMFAAIAKEGAPADEEAEAAEEDERRAVSEADGASESSGDEDDDASGDDSDSSTSSSDDDDGSDNATVAADDEEDEEAVARRDPAAMSLEEEDEFSRELARLMVESGGGGAGGSDGRSKTGTDHRKQALMDVGIPMKRPGRQQGAGNAATGGTATPRDEDDDEENTQPRGITFTLLSKRGNKQQTKSMDIPLDSAIAIHTLEKRAQDAAEHEQLKRLVLDYEQREEASEKQAFRDTLARRGIRVQYKDPAQERG